MTPPAVDRSIVLVGMMGAGKTAIGRRLARALGLPFQDADAAIEAAAGTSIANIFAEIGEPAFRVKERQVIARLLRGERAVVALGGGAFMDPETRALIRETGRSIWLRAELDVLVRRTARLKKRPLLAQGDPRETLARLLERRAPIYEQADLVVDSGKAPVNAVVAQVLAALAVEPVAKLVVNRLARLPVDLGARSYQVVVGPGLLESAGDELRQVLRRPEVIVVTDEHVAATPHLATLEASLAAAAVVTRRIVLPAGEASKSMARARAPPGSDPGRRGRAIDHARRLRRRRHRRSRRLRRRDPAARGSTMCRSRPRCSPRSTARSAARPGSTRATAKI